MKRAEIEITGARAELTTVSPDPIRVGAGTAFFVGGRMPAGWAGEGFAVRAVRREFPVEARAMPEERSYDAGELWWTMLTIPGPVERDEPLPDALPDPRGEAAEHPPWGPLVAICMATYEPEPAQLGRQLDSIRDQTHENWICVISDDHSSPDRFAELERQVAGDGRFLVSRSEERLGFLRNFERAVALAPAEAGLIALADQDDRWDGDKLDLMIAELDSTPSALLAYSDVRIADAAGNVLSDTYFFERRNNHTSMASMLVTNNVTGAASLFRRELLETALPFPPGSTGQELYHDHWLALCALAQGPLVYVDRPTHDYTRHDASVTLTEADGHWVAPPRGRLGAARMRARRFGRRLRLASRSPGWRSAYTGRYLLIRQLGTILLLRLGRDGIAPQHLRDIDRLMAAETSPRAALWLLARSFRPWIGRNDTLARERVIFGGILWRKLVGRRARR